MDLVAESIFAIANASDFLIVGQDRSMTTYDAVNEWWPKLGIAAGLLSALFSLRVKTRTNFHHVGKAVFAAGLLAAFTSLLWDMTNLRAARANRAAAASYEDTRAPCRALLDAISGGSVRSLGSLDPKSVGRVCGEEDFFRAANSSASRLNTLPTGHP